MQKGMNLALVQGTLGLSIKLCVYVWVLQSTISLANSQPVMLLMADLLGAPLAHGICSYQTSGTLIYRNPNNF
jgi:hypothetical protein